MIFAISLLWACSGDDGSAGPAGAAGPAGPAGPPGDPAPAPDPVATAIESSKVESCATCHDGAGDDHQAIYERYVDASTLGLTLNSVTSVPNGALFDVTLMFSITKNGAPFVDGAGLPSLDQKRFYTVLYDSVTSQYLQGNTRLNESNVVPGAVAGDYVLTETGMPFAPELSDAHVYGYIADDALFTHEGSVSELPAGSHVHLYDNVANASLALAPRWLPIRTRMCRRPTWQAAKNAMARRTSSMAIAPARWQDCLTLPLAKPVITMTAPVIITTGNTWSMNRSTGRPAWQRLLTTPTPPI